MRPAAFEFVRARTLGEALELLRPGNGDTVVLAGGQTLLRQMRAREATPRRVVDLSAIEGLDEIAIDDEALVLGALVRLERLASDPAVARACPALREAALRIADVQVRNRATVGGNVCIGPSSDAGTVLAASGGEVVLRDAGGERRVSAADFLRRGERPCGPGEIIVALRFGLSPASAFEKIARRAVDPAIVNAAAVARHEGARVRLDVALGAVHAHVVALPSLELGAEELDGAAFERVVGERAASLDPPSTPHAGAEYRRRVIPVLARRAATRALRRLAGGGA
jgi:aerobic carbon-monoxide dehydrogenase medium subunit